MLRWMIATVSCVAILATSFAAAPVQAQTANDLRLITEFVVPDSNLTKFPFVATRDGFVYVGSNAGRRAAKVWRKPDSALSFTDPVQIGIAEGQPDYSTVAVAGARNGDVYAAWINQPEKRIYVRRRAADGSWDPARIAVSGSPFPVQIAVGVASDSNTVFVVWRDPDQPAKYAYSPDRGLNWTPTNNLGNFKAYSSPLSVATGPTGQVGVAWTGDTGNSLQIFVALWNGSAFSIERVTNLDAIYADASLSFAPNGTPYVAYRRDGESSGAVFYAERQPDGRWPPSRLAGGSKVEGTVSVNADDQGNLHFNWLARPGGPSRAFYAFRDVTGEFVGPIASNTAGALFNSRAAASVSDAVYSHMVMEQFSGGTSFVRYSLFQAPGIVFGAQPELSLGGATPRGAEDTILVNFLNPRRVTATAQVRWRWGQPPTDAANDSNGWQPYASPLRIRVPQSIVNDTSCQPSTLYTQLRDPGTGLIEERPKQASIVVDRLVEATVAARNPFLAPSNTATAGTAVELAAIAGASIGDPTYTRVPLVYLEIASDANGDCSGLKSVGIGRSDTTIETVYQIDNNRFSGFVPLPGMLTLQNGPVPVTMQVIDGVGNRRNFTYTFIFDEAKPVLSATAPGTITPTANPTGDLLQTLQFTNISVADDTYPGRGFWGVMIANSRTQVDDPLSANLDWTELRAPGSSGTFRIDGWSLATGLPASQVTAGQYYVYVRFFDGAGNVSDGYIEVPVTSQAQRPTTHLPLVRR
jgi:hypothetical protein